MVELGRVTRLTSQNDVFNHMLTALRERDNVVDCRRKIGSKRTMTVSATRLTREQVQKVLCRYVAVAHNGAASVCLRPENEFTAQSTAKACSASQIIGLVLCVVALMTRSFLVLMGVTICLALDKISFFVAGIPRAGKQLVTLAALRSTSGRLSLVSRKVLVGFFDVTLGTYFAWHIQHDTPSIAICQVS